MSGDKSYGCRCEVCGWGRGGTGVMETITSNSEADAVFFCFEGTVGRDKVSIGDLMVFCGSEG